MSGAHAALAPSSAHIWAPEGGCRAYPRLSALFPDDDGPEAAEGTAAHWYVTETVAGRQIAIGDLAPNGIQINDEMVDCGAEIISDVRATMAVHPGAELFIEQRFAIPAIGPDNWGTPDFVLVDAARRIVFIWDYKYGHGYVDAVENWQMLNYFAGVLSRVAASGLGWDEWRAVLTVVQPRNYHPSGTLREWGVSGETLRTRFLPQFRKAAAECRDPDAPATTGEHCRYCEARHACPAMLQTAMHALDVSRAGDPHIPSPAALGLELKLIHDALKRLEARKTGLEAQAMGLIRSGQGVPFFTAGYSSGREAWVTPPAEVFALGDVLGVDLRKPEAAVTPNQARKALKPYGIDGSVIDAYARRPSGGLKLIPADEKAARLAFE